MWQGLFHGLLRMGIGGTAFGRVPPFPFPESRQTGRNFCKTAVCGLFLHCALPVCLDDMAALFAPLALNGICIRGQSFRLPESRCAAAGVFQVACMVLDVGGWFENACLCGLCGIFLTALSEIKRGFPDVFCRMAALTRIYLVFLAAKLFAL